jgi:hypothetical protein
MRVAEANDRLSARNCHSRSNPCDAGTAANLPKREFTSPIAIIRRSRRSTSPSKNCPRTHFVNDKFVEHYAGLCVHVSTDPATVHSAIATEQTT